MPGVHTLDDLVRTQLRKWPHRPPGIVPRRKVLDVWMRARPGNEAEGFTPFLKLPGANRMRTLPDGLWLNFSGSSDDPYVDILAIEACCSLQNLLDKRSRFAPSTQSLLAVCPLPWLTQRAMQGDDTQRWQLLGLLSEAPKGPLVVPVRDMRVLYALKDRHYHGFAASQVPHAHEFFCPMDALTEEEGYTRPDIQALLSRMNCSTNFLLPP